MTPLPSRSIDFRKISPQLSSGQLWEYARWTAPPVDEVAQEVYRSLQDPIDFPAVDAAIVPGDHVALAIDPNVPGIVPVVHGILRAIGETQAAGVEIVLWDEASDETVSALQHEVGESTRVVRHQSAERASLRYLGADQAADPVYLNRRLVDADFVLPVVVGRWMDVNAVHDVTGVFPSLADTASRLRQRKLLEQPLADRSGAQTEIDEPSWLLGVQLIISVIPSDAGGVGEIVTGTPDSIRKRLASPTQSAGDFPPNAPLVIASLDGDGQQQTWCNAARAAAAAARFVQPGGTIVLWTAIDDPPETPLLDLSDPDRVENAAVETPELIAEDEDFSRWDQASATAATLRRVATEYRLLVHSHLEDETIESMGLGAVHSEDDLARLSASFDTCGVLRGAQFAGTTFGLP